MAQLARDVMGKYRLARSVHNKLSTALQPANNLQLPLVEWFSHCLTRPTMIVDTWKTHEQNHQYNSGFG